MKRPIVGGVNVAEPLLSLPLCLSGVPSIDLDGRLADFTDLSVIAEYILDEVDDEARHGAPLSRLAGEQNGTR
jgi:hypothetical protein